MAISRKLFYCIYLTPKGKMAISRKLYGENYGQGNHIYRQTEGIA